MLTVQSVEKKKEKTHLGRAVFVLLFSTSSTHRKLHTVLCVKTLDSIISKFSPYRFKHCRESRGNPCRRSVPAAVRVQPTKFSNIFSECPEFRAQLHHHPAPARTYSVAQESQVCPLYPTQNCFLIDTRMWQGWTACKESLWL